MKAEVVVLLVANLLSLPADTAVATAATGSRVDLLHSPVADSADRVNVLQPVGTEFEIRRKRSPPPGVDRTGMQHVRRLPTFERDRDERLAEPNIAE